MGARFSGAGGPADFSQNFYCQCFLLYFEVPDGPPRMVLARASEQADDRSALCGGRCVEKV